jgi:FtsP/CotA-like multicopper oxidase with cupredoxin domain
MLRGLVVKGLGILVGVSLAGLLAFVGWSWYESRLPATYNVMDFGEPDYGGGRVPAAGAHGVHAFGHASRGTSVADLHGDRKRSPDARFALTAKKATIRLASGRTIDALTFDGRSPGPELRVRQGDLVQVKLVNQDVSRGVTIHWHGVDVPNAEDGVAGVTEDAVLPGKHHVYRFRAKQVGTFWYHTHQVSSKDVRRGLFGAIVIEPRQTATEDLDVALVAHTFDGIPTLNANDRLERRAVPPGSRVRLRLVNSDSVQRRFTLDGTRFRVVAIDGTELNRPTEIQNVTIEVGGGARSDLAFTMPETPVRLSLVDSDAGLVLSSTGKATASPTVARPDFDPTTYGRPAATPFDASSAFDRRFELTIGRKPGFFDGRPGLQWSINGGIFPDVPVFVVEKGDLVAMTITNDTKAVHPMHLHGHHALVLSRNGEAITGSPWWVDTLNLKRGDTYEIAFRADNPGIWMDHCHNLPHAADGLTMHLVYAGVTTPFSVGDDARNQPE